MPRKCSVEGCRTGYDSKPGSKSIPVFRFPGATKGDDPQMKELWAKQIGKNVHEISKWQGVCARHFPSDVKCVRKGRTISPREPPTLFLELDCLSNTFKNKTKKNPVKSCSKQKNPSPGTLSSVINRRNDEFKQKKDKKKHEIKEELYDNDLQVQFDNTLTSSDCMQLFKLESKNHVERHHDTFKKAEISTIISTKDAVSDSISEVPIHGNEQSEIVLKSLKQAIQAVFCQFFHFDSELKFEGFILLDIDRKKKVKYPLNENIVSKSEKEVCLSSDDVQNQISKKQTLFLDDKSETSVKESDDSEVQSHLPLVRNQELQSLEGGCCDDDGSSENERHDIGEPGTLASVFNRRNHDEIKHLCKKCKISFPTKLLLGKHNKVAHLHPYYCSICDINLANKSDHSKHNRIKQHFAEHRFPCEICGDRYITARGLMIHAKNHDGYKPFKCTICAQAFRVPCRLRRHEQMHTNTKPFECDQCDKKYANISDLKIHTITHHKPMNCRPYKCSICHWSFVARSKYKLHMMRHNGVKPFQCEQCGKGFFEAHVFNIHKRIHSGEKPFICEVCGEGFISTITLKHHEKVKHPNKSTQDLKNAKLEKHKFKCLLCNKSYLKNRYLFEKHVMSHMGIDPYPSEDWVRQSYNKFPCEICGKEFPSKFRLSNHMTIKHLRGEKKFSCNVCGQKFYLNCYLSKHKKTHLGLKPFVCKVCGLAYTSNQTLRIHERTHTGEMFGCDQCGKSYVEKRVLLKHRRMVHNIHEGYENDDAIRCESGLDFAFATPQF